MSLTLSSTILYISLVLECKGWIIRYQPFYGLRLYREEFPRYWDFLSLFTYSFPVSPFSGGTASGSRLAANCLLLSEFFDRMFVVHQVVYFPSHLFLPYFSLFIFTLKLASVVVIIV